MIFIIEYSLKNKPTSNINLFEVLNKIGLNSKVGIYLRDENFSTSNGVHNLHPSKGKHWVCFINDCYFDS